MRYASWQGAFILSSLMALGCGSDSGGGGKAHKGLGAICTSDDDCTSGLTCHIDTTDYVAHHLCTQVCISSEACVAEFGEGTFCIGDNLCVVECLTDDDCVSGTVCNRYGWCERGGPGSGMPICKGAVTSCYSIADEGDCISASCTWEGECSGVSESCYNQLSSFACGELDGCYWNSSSEYCSGVSESCYSYSSSTSCIFQSGCDWSGECSGTSEFASCEEAGTIYCEFIPGCSLTTQ
jgi:hypothetical protein